MNEKEKSTKIMSKLYLRLSSKYLNSEKSIQDVSNSLSSAGKCSRDEFCSSLNKFISDPLLKSNIMKSFDESLKGITDANEKNVGIFSSSYRRKNFFQKNPKFVKPLQVPILDSQGKDTGDFFSYVPLPKTLQVMLQNKNIREYCIKVPEVRDLKGFFDITDGSVFKNNPFFQNCNRLRLVLFQDAFNPCEAIGPAKNLYKLIGVYLMLFNLPPHQRSKVENIKLVLLCFEKHVKEYGWKEILKTLVADLLVLEKEGIDVYVSEEIYKFWGSIATVCGDNLGSNDLGGFIKKFNGGCCCRQCERSVKDFRENIFLAKPLRKVATYNENLAQARELHKSVKGVQDDCPFNALEHYHVCLPGLPGCIGHDVFEGFAKEDVHEGLFYFIDEKKWFTLKLLNTRIKNMTLSNMSTIDIPEIKRKEKGKPAKLTGVAYQIRHLVLILPILIADKVQDLSDPVWQMLLNLREIVNLICAPALSESQVGILSNKIETYLQLRVELFPDIPLKPKHAFMQHYPHTIQALGPLKHLWTLRFESKHAFFKYIIERMRNFINLQSSLAEKHELMQSSLENDFSDTIQVDDFHSINLNSSEKILLQTKIDANLDQAIQNLNAKSPVKFLSNKITFRNVTYAEGMHVCVGTSKFGGLIICKIDKIALNHDLTTFYFLGKSFEIVFNDDVGVYEAETRDNSNLPISSYHYSDLLSPDPVIEASILLQNVYLTKYAPYIDICS